jgi:mono/diheme cytochrome c family protein
MNFLKTLVLLVALALVGAAAFVAAGVYPIGADVPHWPLTERALALLRSRAIETQARGIAVPNLDDPKLLAEGAEHYAAMCTGCHLAPGMTDSELRAGLYPQPPNFSAPGSRIDPAQAFWVIKHGVKLTAMPAWGKTHGDEAIWGLVAFLRRLPQMTPEQYQQATSAAGAHEHHHHDHDDHDEAAGGEPHDADADHGH